MSRATTKKLVNPLVVHVGRHANYTIYVLEGATEDRLKEAFPRLRRIPRVILGYASPEDFVPLHSPHWPYISTMLTGLTPEQIGQLGGVRLYDPSWKQEEVIWEWRPHVTHAG